MVSSRHLQKGQSLSQLMPLEASTSHTGTLPWRHNHRKLVIFGKMSSFQIQVPWKKFSEFPSCPTNMMVFPHVGISPFTKISDWAGSNLILYGLRKDKGDSLPVPHFITPKFSNSQIEISLIKRSFNHIP